MQLNGCVSFHNMVINSTNEIVYHSVLSIVILGDPIRLDFCFHGKTVHPIMNALKNSFEEERQSWQILQNQSHIYQARSIFYHNITRLSHTLYSIKKETKTEDIYFKNFNHKTIIYNLASEVMSQRVTWPLHTKVLLTLFVCGATTDTRASLRTWDCSKNYLKNDKKIEFNGTLRACSFYFGWSIII